MGRLPAIMALGKNSFLRVGFFDCVLADAKVFEPGHLLYLWVKTQRQEGEVTGPVSLSQRVAKIELHCHRFSAQPCFGGMC